MWTYQPLTRLMANKRLSANLRIVRLLNFINSEQAGFHCASLFLIRKHIKIPFHIAPYCSPKTYCSSTT